MFFCTFDILEDVLEIFAAHRDHAVALGHVDVMTLISRWAMRTSSDSTADKEQVCWV